jgi:hypothetical protein
MVRDDHKLPEDTGEVPKIEWNGWRFDYQPENLLFSLLDGKIRQMASFELFQKQNKRTEAEQATYRARTLVGHARKGSGRRGPEEESATPG